MYKMLYNPQFIIPPESRSAPGSHEESSGFALDVALLIQMPSFLEELKMPGSWALAHDVWQMLQMRFLSLRKMQQLTLH